MPEEHVEDFILPVKGEEYSLILTIVTVFLGDNLTLSKIFL